MPTIIPNLWFDDQAQAAADFYVSLFPNARVTGRTHYTEAGPGEPGSLLTVSFTLDGQPFVAINGGPAHAGFTETISFAIECEDQAEIDRYWDRLTADGGQEQPCGWCKDRFGLSWQVVPKGMDDFFANEDPAAVNRAMEAMFTMKKLDLAALRAAADGTAAPA